MDNTARFLISRALSWRVSRGKEPCLPNMTLPLIMQLTTLAKALPPVALPDGIANTASPSSRTGCDHLLLPTDYAFVMVPSIIDNEPSPLIIDLHGAGMDGRSQSFASGLNSWTRTHRIWPTGYPTGDGGYVWNAGKDTYPPAATLNIDHVAQLDRVICYAQCQHNVSGVFLAGLSNGAAMAQRLGRESHHAIDGIIAWSHSIVETLDAHASSGRPVPIILLSGTLDVIWGNEQNMKATVDGWKLYNGCADGEMAGVSYKELGNVTIRTQRYRDCTSPVTYVRLYGVGHYFPVGLFAAEEVDAMLAPRGGTHRVGVSARCSTFASPSISMEGSDPPIGPIAGAVVSIIIGIALVGGVICCFGVAQPVEQKIKMRAFSIRVRRPSHRPPAAGTLFVTDHESGCCGPE